MSESSNIGKILRRMVIFAVILIAGVYVTFALFARFFSENLIFQPQAGLFVKDKNVITIAADSDENITAKFFESPGAEYTILFSHGNAEDIFGSTPFFERLRDAGFNVLAYDYRGYGLSGGRPTERNAYEDIDAAYDYLVANRGIDPSKIIIHGRSLGGAVSIDLAARRKCGGLIAESTFTSAFRIMTEYRVLPFDRFESVDKIDRVTCPVLFIHGEKDTLIKPWHSQSLFSKTKASKEMFVVEKAGHNDVAQIAGDAYFQRIRDFAANLPK